MATFITSKSVGESFSMLVTGSSGYWKYNHDSVDSSVKTTWDFNISVTNSNGEFTLIPCDADGNPSGYLTRVTFGYASGITTLDTTGFGNVQTLEIPGSPISSLDISNLGSLSHLDIGGTLIPSLNMSTLTNLSSLSLWNKGLTSINDFILPSSLNRLILNSNTLTSLDLSALTNLEFLYLGQNQLTPPVFSGFVFPSGLKELYLDNNALLTSLDLSNLTSLIKLSFQGGSYSNTKISSFLPSNYVLPSSLQNLDLANNSISVFNGTGFPSNISRLDLNLNPLTSVDVTSLININYINMEGDGVSQMTPEANDLVIKQLDQHGIMYGYFGSSNGRTSSSNTEYTHLMGVLLWSLGGLDLISSNEGVFNNLLKFNSSLVIDETFQCNTTALSISTEFNNLDVSKFKMSVDSTDKILLFHGNEINQLINEETNTFAPVYCAMLNADGSLDTNFAANTIPLNEDDSYAIELGTNLISGTAIYSFGLDKTNERFGRMKVVKMDLSGSIDTNFVLPEGESTNEFFVGKPNHAIRLDNGKIVLLGDQFSKDLTYIPGISNLVNLANIVIVNSDFTIDNTLTQVKGDMYNTNQDYKTSNYLQKHGNKFSLHGSYFDYVGYNGDTSRIYNNDNGYTCHYLIDTENFISSEIFNNRYFTTYNNIDHHNDVVNSYLNPSNTVTEYYNGYIPNPTPEQQQEIDNYKAIEMERWTNEDAFPNSWNSDKCRTIWPNQDGYRNGVLPKLPQEIFGPITNLVQKETENNRNFRLTPGTKGEYKYLESEGDFNAWNDTLKRWDYGIYGMYLEGALSTINSWYNIKNSSLHNIIGAIKPFTWSSYHIPKHVIGKIN